MRLDQYVAQFWPEHSRSTWQKYIERGYVQINGDVETSVKKTLGEDDVVTIHIPEAPDFSDQTLPVIYEDEHVIVINKPSGVLTHAKGAISEELTVADFIRPKLAMKELTNRSGIVHRLDRDTSGVIICAKDDDTARLLQKQFQDRKAHKHYLTVVKGHLTQETGRIDVPIERNPKKPAQFRAGANGKHAITDFTTIARNKAYTVVELKPETGRTHQLRVHLAYLGTPIVGDVIYGNGKSPIDRLCLHAKSLEITIPKSHRMTFEAPTPDDMQQFIDDIARG